MKNIKTYEDFNEVNEDYSLLLEKNVAKDKSLWDSCVAWAKSKYDVW